ncbi:Bax inhibitor-1/YccA family protein [Micromonospora sp. HM5-17]|uniref:Bax inhibitor-1/YccA family protein n=1 Tax=Micromonospora sp. HM5-17 TaxID=2487710 RepID=UPI000F46418C|nr:Bax inhibitor-1/YccA family protein [Micromonospora sp. HM5-17]ROT31510.1 Bax inhibitor-1/YccA family protein [Micromonospora sp. HM5-17]
MESANPVLTRLPDTARDEHQLLGAVGARAMSVDDVVPRTGALLVLTGIVGATAWMAVPAGWAGVAALGSALAGLVLALVISVRRITNPVLIGGYAVLQGILLGVASRGFEAVYPGIVVQAVVGTFAVFLGMSLLYGLRVLRATPRFTRLVVGALLGVVVLGLVNLAIYLIAGRQILVVYSTGSRVGWLPYVFALVCITVGALTFILDLDLIERSVQAGLPTRYAWYCAFGLLVGLVFLYWQLLRLISYVRR